MLEKSLNTYCRVLENLTPGDIVVLDSIVAEDVHFRDPFNDCIGLENYKIVLRDMFVHLGSLRFEVCDFSLSKSPVEANNAMISWQLECFLKSMKNEHIVIEGMSTLCFDSTGKVSKHFDYWDAASNVYEKFPILGLTLRTMMKRISSKVDS